MSKRKKQQQQNNDSNNKQTNKTYPVRLTFFKKILNSVFSLFSIRLETVEKVISVSRDWVKRSNGMRRIYSSKTPGYRHVELKVRKFELEIRHWMKVSMPVCYRCWSFHKTKVILSLPNPPSFTFLLYLQTLSKLWLRRETMVFTLTPTTAHILHVTSR